ncbi:MAG TPA: N-acetylornithine carbamoyltransferase [Pyrinomonadaceae bacterium]|nr:N-acetylornithine carbamoyltransferase [Pyrinomonadaceae bacterium]
MNDFLRTSDYPTDSLQRLIDAATAIKKGAVREKSLDGKSVALVFFNPSLRTRASMQVGIFELGGNPVILEPGSTSWTLEHREGVVMDGNKTEHLKEFVRVLERYVSAIGVRTFAELSDWEVERTDPILNAFADYASVPVINLESAMHHPCQAMADMLTIRENFGAAKKKVLLTWAWHPKPLPMAVPNSFALAAAQFGHDLRIAHPKGYELDGDLVAEVQRQTAQNGGTVEFTNDVQGAFESVDVVYAKSWGGSQFYGTGDADMDHRGQFRNDWIVDDKKMARTKDAIFMHCLPVRRNVIVADSVIDSARSVVIDEAENRLHVQKAIMSEIIK